MVWSLLLQAGSEGPSPISRAVAHAFPYNTNRARGALTCYYFHESAFFSWRNYLEGAILSYDTKAQLCINSLSPRVEQFRKSEIVFSMLKGLCDPQKEELSDHGVMIADCEIDRKRSNQVINYLQEKYSLDHLRAISLKQFTSTTLVDDGDKQ